MSKLRVLDLFSGIGGFSLGLERTGGFETVAFCEIDPFCQKVLAKHWPDVRQYHDVRDLTAERLAADGITVDVITGGFPCQDISLAGKQEGMGANTRSGLWSEIDRLIGELSPKFVIVENVANLLSGPSNKPGGWFSRILSDLAGRGFDAEWQNIPAAAMGAPHRRERVWIVAYAQQTRGDKRPVTDEAREWLARTHANNLVSSWPSANDFKERAEGLRAQEVSGFAAFSWRQNVRGVEDYFRCPNIPEPLFCGTRDGIPDWVDRVGACGNSVIPQIPEMIGNAILQAEKSA